MRFLRLSLTGYIGIYNGLHLETIDIDLSKCKNTITIIAGPNGVGKSTICNALTVFPDNNSSFVPSMTAKKHIVLADKNNVYEINIVHPLDKNNNRGTSKITISKNGMELNPNGNVSSYKEIICNEFGIDMNFMSLSKISNRNKGLVDKTPSERKKCLAANMNTVDTYNEMYKNLNKKANYYNSYLKSMTGKIQNIGNEDLLRSNLAAYTIKYKDFKTTIDDLKRKITESSTILAMNDPENKMQIRYNELMTRIHSVNTEVDNSYRELISFKNKNIHDEFDISDIDTSISLNIKVMNNEEKEKIRLETEISSKMNLHKSLLNDIDKLQIKINELDNDIDKSILENVSLYESKLSEIETEFDKIGISDMDSISKDEIDQFIDCINLFLIYIDDLYSVSTVDQLENISMYYSSDISKLKSENLLKIDKLKEMIANSRKQIDEYKSNIKTLEILSKRPKNCSIDDCYFVSNYINETKCFRSTDIKALEKFIEVESDNIEKYNIELNNCIENDKELDNMVIILSKLRVIMTLIESNKKILSKFPISLGLIGNNSLFKFISIQNRFNDLRDLSNYKYLSNSIIEYKGYKEIYEKIKNQIVIYSNNQKIISEYRLELDSKKKELSTLEKEMNILYQNKNNSENLYLSTKNRISNLETYNRLYIKWKDLSKEKSDIEKETEAIKNNFDSSLKMIKELENLKSILAEKENSLSQLENEKKSVESKINMLDTFKQEYSIYKEKYEYIDVLRNYSSPTRDGIQRIYMSMYIDSTLSTANKILSMMFKGKYQLLEYKILEDEFKIPFIGESGLPVDDISSGSDSQVAIMSMIINIVLFDKSSDIYRIISLDEIDGTLDQYNRSIFVTVLQYILQIIRIDQMFTISHSIESALTNVDVILLSNDSEYLERFSNSNIVYTVS